MKGSRFSEEQIIGILREAEAGRCHLWGGFATFHWQCFGAYLRSETEQQVEGAVWKASHL